LDHCLASERDAQSDRRVLVDFGIFFSVLARASESQSWITWAMSASKVEKSKNKPDPDRSLAMTMSPSPQTWTDMSLVDHMTRSQVSMTGFHDMFP
jgi:hypothetical protein